MGDLNGGDEQLVGNLSGVGSSGAGSHQEFAYQSSSHNIGYSVSMAGVSFAATTDLVRGADATQLAAILPWVSNGRATWAAQPLVSLWVQSKIGTKTEDSMSASVSWVVSLSRLCHTPMTTVQYYALRRQLRTVVTHVGATGCSS